MKRWVAATLGVATALVASCASPEDSAPAKEQAEGRVTQVQQPAQALTDELMIGLALAKNYHHKADVYLKGARTEDAVAAIREILRIEFGVGAPEGEDVKNDARARLATLLITMDKLDQAMTVVDDGIANAARESFFVANLHSVRGDVFHARATQMGDSDDRDPAARAKAKTLRLRAIESYDRAISIQKALMNKIPRGQGEESP